MRKTKFLPKTPTCPVCMPHTWTRTPTNHRTLSNRLQPISPQDFGETERTFFSCVVDTVKRKNEGNSSSSWEATFVSVQLYLHSTKAQPQSPRGALYCKVDAAIIVMWRNVCLSATSLYSPLTVGSLFVSLPLHKQISLSWNRLHKVRVMFS